ncbi:MAG TPA: orotate phosphoribosyltransferase [Gemmatimonadaceae bacterium]|nr:orotate phosphoribosyltransferase [Gemmatimonadaceae bacterium]
MTATTASAQDLTERLLHLLAKHSLRRGEFVLASGVKSNYYIDARLTTMRPEGLTTIARLALTRMGEVGWRPDAVGGLTLGADPIAYAIAFESMVSGRPVRAFTVRKEAKSHGTQQLIEGPLAHSDHVVVVEDVLTTGGSALRAVDAVRSFGATVLGVLAVVDREQGGVENLTSAGLPSACLVRVSQVLAQTS